MYILKRSCCKLSKKFIYIWNQFDCVTTLYYCWSLVTTQPQIWSDLRANTGSLPLELPACIDVCSVTRLRTKPGYHGRCISHLSDSCLSAYPALWLQLAKLAQIKKRRSGERFSKIWLKPQSLCDCYLLISCDQESMMRGWNAESDHFWCVYLVIYICPFFNRSICFVSVPLCHLFFLFF